MARGYHRALMGGGHILKAVSRARRAAASNMIGRAPGKTPGPAVYKTDLRKARRIDELNERLAPYFPEESA